MPIVRNCTTLNRLSHPCLHDLMALPIISFPVWLAITSGSSAPGAR
jgi:hypothetical protein